MQVQPLSWRCCAPLVRRVHIHSSSDGCAAAALVTVHRVGREHSQHTRAHARTGRCASSPSTTSSSSSPSPTRATRPGDVPTVATVLWLRRLPWSTPRALIESCLHDSLAACGCAPRGVLVAGLRRGRARGAAAATCADHAGHAFVMLGSVGDAERAEAWLRAHGLHGVCGGGDGSSGGGGGIIGGPTLLLVSRAPTQLLPPAWVHPDAADTATASGATSGGSHEASSSSSSRSSSSSGSSSTNRGSSSSSAGDANSGSSGSSSSAIGSSNRGGSSASSSSSSSGAGDAISSSSGSGGRTQAQREHGKRQRASRLRARADELGRIVSLLQAPGGTGIASEYQPICPAAGAAASVSMLGGAGFVGGRGGGDLLGEGEAAVSGGGIDWELLPEACLPSERHAFVAQPRLDEPSTLSPASSLSSNALLLTRQPHQPSSATAGLVPRASSRGGGGGGGASLRVQRKRAQVESFLLVLQQLLPPTALLPHGRSDPGGGDDGAGGSGGDGDSSAPMTQELCAPTGGNGGGSGGGNGVGGVGGGSEPGVKSGNGGDSSATMLQGRSAPTGGGGRVLRVVEFGCGSGNLLLPLAACLPCLEFHGVDAKPEAVSLLRARAAAAGLTNVTASVGYIEQFKGTFDVALALHACGTATDYALMQATARRAAFVCSPCCIGKVRTDAPRGAGTAGGGDSGADSADGASTSTSTSSCASSSGAGGRMLVSQPRCAWMRSCLQQQQQAATRGAHAAFLSLARAADISHRGSSEVGGSIGGSGGGEPSTSSAAPAPPASSSQTPPSPPPPLMQLASEHSHAPLALLAKSNLELDRLMAAREERYATALCTLLRPGLLPTKSDLLVGVPTERMVDAGVTGGGGDASAVFRWAWRRGDEDVVGDTCFDGGR
ncbi:hypothetical protein FOA52_007192 [Chlamydomonas sp. UWO 241]|nr:hypothetical protein FOA52_007192 [Chlamydomonas sp. UWO 241]